MLFKSMLKGRGIQSVFVLIVVPLLISLVINPSVGSHMGGFMSKGTKQQFPKSLKGFKYQFNGDGQLRHTETGHQFEFMVKDNDHQYNQKRYEALGKIIDGYIYKQLEAVTHLKRVTIQDDSSEDAPTGFFFASDDALTNADKLMVIIHGSGVVRAGQWSRRLIINDCLETGTQLPYIQRAIKMGYAVVVTNTNLNYEDDDTSKRLIPGSANPEEHMMYVWDNFVKKCPAKIIDVVAHSYGGVVMVHWFNSDPLAREKVNKVAFTDSVHSMYREGASQETADWFIKHSINWVSTFALLNAYEGQVKNDVHKLSAGTDVHELTSHSAIKSVFWFFAGEGNALDFLNKTGLNLEEEITIRNSQSLVHQEEEKEQQGDKEEQQEDAEEEQTEEKRQQGDEKEHQGDKTEQQGDKEEQQEEEKGQQGREKVHQGDKRAQQERDKTEQQGGDKQQQQEEKVQGDEKRQQGDKRAQQERDETEQQPEENQQEVQVPPADQKPVSDDEAQKGSEQRAYGEEKSCETEPVEAKTEDKHSVLVDDKTATQQCFNQLTAKEEESCELGIQQSLNENLEKEEPTQQNPIQTNAPGEDDKHQQPEQNLTAGKEQESQSVTDRE